MLIVHEVVKIDGDKITTRGTANNTDDEPISAKDIKGRVAFSIGGVGTVISLIKTPAVAILVLMLAVFLLFKSYSKEKDEKDEQDEKIEEIRREIERIKEERKK